MSSGSDSENNQEYIPCKYDETMHRGLKTDQVLWKDVFWHRFEMRCKECGKLFGIYNQKTMVKEYFDTIYNRDNPVDPEINSVMNTDPRMKSVKLRAEIESANKEHNH